jgi:hypothetical protein
MPSVGHVLDNLPLPLNRFIGRAAEINALKQRVWSTRLLKLTGPAAAARPAWPCASPLICSTLLPMACGGLN